MLDDRCRAPGRRPAAEAGSAGRERKEGGDVTTSFLIELSVLILAAFLGLEVISKVPTLLHTPLMSGTNAIHGIVVVGAIVVAGIPGQPTWLHVVTLAAVALGTGNAVGGFVVTDRMLQMFRRRKPAPAQTGADEPEKPA
jgi:NAD(P) transhydrogenase subunit alpha